METSNPDAFLHQFNDTIDQWINSLDNYTLERLLQKPFIDFWSLGQVYVHIIEDTKYFISQIKMALLNDDNMDKEMHEDAKAMYQNNELPDILMSSPSTTSIRQPTSKDELLHGLGFIKEQVNNLYCLPDFSKSTGKTKHPGLLFFTASEWLRFAEMHMRHHFRQKKRIDDKLFL